MLVRPLSALIACLAASACAPPAVADKGGDDITGEVRFVGAAPAVRTIDRSLEPNCENGTAFVETVLSWDGKLANVHVAIEVGTMGVHKAPKKPVIVQQADCLYQPRVQGLMRGQRVLVVNGDPNMHNVHAKSAGESLSNRSQPAKASALEVDSSSAGPVLELGCDVHRWMRAYMPITDHPYFDVTGPDGSFTIRGVPKRGKVMVRAWHEKFGELRKQASAGESLTFSFVQL